MSAELPSSEVLNAMRAASFERYLLAAETSEVDALLADNRAAAIDTDRDPTIGILVVIAGLLFGVLALMAAAIFVGAWLLGAT